MGKKKKPPLAGMMYATVKKFTDSATHSSVSAVTETLTTDPNNANVTTSLTADNVLMHNVVIDLDLPAKLVESSTPGHHHLYIDKPMSKTDYFKLLTVMVEVGLIEPGYLGASEKRGYTAVRLPWVKKTEEERREIEARKAARAQLQSNPPEPF